ncbi:acyl-CoA thioesterase [Rubritalea marina]|uniref:acyl-CoA thioesterase n=1 Tax=Rubritalea marina TaxID=361055 RepID=UPI000367DD0B|nr:hotdog domain-containing protein [Rubritalea marina]
METHRLVLTEDLNQYGFLFGGRLLSWADELGYIAASNDFPDANFVTIGMGEVAFKKPVKNGAILCLKAVQSKRGTTSVSYEISVTAGQSTEQIFSTDISFVNVYANGQKRALSH